MSSRPKYRQLLAWLLGAGVLGSAVWFGVGLAHESASRHRGTLDYESVGAARPNAAVRAHDADDVSRAQERPTPNANGPLHPVSDDDFIDSRYPNQVIADVKPRVVDTPAEFEKKVRAMDPEYAKLLDESAAEERAAAERAAAARRPGVVRLPRQGNDDMP